MSPATSWTSIGSSGCKSKNVSLPEYVKAEKKGSMWPVPDSLDVVRGGTIPDVYKLIKRTLNLGLPKPLPVAPPKVKSLEKAYESSMKAYRQREEREAAGIPWTKTPSLHRLHTEWDEDIMNIEVLLGLKKPKNSREALAVRMYHESDASSSSSGNDSGRSVAFDNSNGVSTGTAQASLNEGSKAGVEDVDSGLASCGVSDTTN